MCTIDWDLLASWVSAIANVAVVVVAFFGYWIWKKRFFKHRDHDMALRVLRVVHDCSARVTDFRSRASLIADNDVPVRNSERDDPREDLDFRINLARYRSRHHRLNEVIRARTDVLREAYIVLAAEADELRTYIDLLDKLEVRLLVQGRHYVQNLHPDDIDPMTIDDTVLWLPPDLDPANPLSNDPFAMEYNNVIKQIRELMTPRIQMK